MTTRDDIIAVAGTLLETLRQRGETHGRGDSNFIVAAELLTAMGYRRVSLTGDAPGVHRLDALDVTAIYTQLKQARIACGDRGEPDHWLDTAGYGVIGAAMAVPLRNRAQDEPEEKVEPPENISLLAVEILGQIHRGVFGTVPLTAGPIAQSIAIDELRRAGFIESFYNGGRRSSYLSTTLNGEAYLTKRATHVRDR